MGREIRVIWVEDFDLPGWVVQRDLAEDGAID